MKYNINEMVFIWLGEGIDERPNVATCVVMHILFVLILKPKSLIFFGMETNQMFTVCDDFESVQHGLHHLKCDMVLNCLLMCF
jgi:hypothetical protein